MVPVDLADSVQKYSYMLTDATTCYDNSSVVVEHNKFYWQNTELANCLILGVAEWCSRLFFLFFWCYVYRQLCFREPSYSHAIPLQGFSRLASRIHAYEVSSIPTRISHQKYHQIADVSTTESSSGHISTELGIQSLKY